MNQKILLTREIQFKIKLGFSDGLHRAKILVETLEKDFENLMKSETKVVLNIATFKKNCENNKHSSSSFSKMAKLYSRQITSNKATTIGHTLFDCFNSMFTRISMEEKSFKYIIEQTFFSVSDDKDGGVVNESESDDDETALNWLANYNVTHSRYMNKSKMNKMLNEVFSNFLQNDEFKKRLRLGMKHKQKENLTTHWSTSENYKETFKEVS